MKPFNTVAVVVFSLVALLQLLRVLSGWEGVHTGERSRHSKLGERRRICGRGRACGHAVARSASVGVVLHDRERTRRAVARIHVSLRREHASPSRDPVGRGAGAAQCGIATRSRRCKRWRSQAASPMSSGRDDSGRFTFCDCSAESPAGRRSLCYDGDARAARKEHKPEGSAVEMARAMGIDLLAEEAYRRLQTLGASTRRRRVGLRRRRKLERSAKLSFCDRRYGKVFVYHNGAQSYYAARGFRGSLRV